MSAGEDACTERGMTRRWSSAAAGALVAASVSLPPRPAWAHGESLADSLLLMLLGVGSASLAALVTLIGGVVVLVKLSSGTATDRHRAVGRWFGWANLALGVFCFIGALLAMPRSADGWKLFPAGLPLSLIGVALLVLGRRPAARR